MLSFARLSTGIEWSTFDRHRRSFTAPATRACRKDDAADLTDDTISPRIRLLSTKLHVKQKVTAELVLFSLRELVLVLVNRLVSACKASKRGG